MQAILKTKELTILIHFKLVSEQEIKKFHSGCIKTMMFQLFMAKIRKIWSEQSVKSKLKILANLSWQKQL